MKKNTFLLIIGINLLVVIGASAQSFQQVNEYALTGSLSFKSLRLIDFDSDSVLDVMVESVDENNYTVLTILKSNLAGQLTFQQNIETQLTDTWIEAIDFNNDNSIDLVAAGNDGSSLKTIMFENLGSFTFQVYPLEFFPGKLVMYADIDNDSKRDAFVYQETNLGESLLIIFKKKGDQWSPIDTLAVLPHAMQVYDFDKDLFPDIVISGVFTGVGPQTRLYITEGVMKFNSTVLNSSSTNFSVSDFNVDGFLDIATESADGSLNKIYYPAWEEEPMNFSTDRIKALFSGDLNNDGRCDLSFVRRVDSTTVVLTKNATDFAMTILPLTDVCDQAFGDFDRDGDLDIVQLVKHEGYKIRAVENTASIANVGPEAIGSGWSANIYNRLFLLWQQVHDDHTDSRSITYDMALSGESESTTGSFDWQTLKRSMVTHGNLGTNTMVLLKPSQNISAIFLQTVDNAYEARKQPCRFGGIPGCTQQIVYNDRPVCRDEQLMLTLPNQGLWVSFTKGFIGYADSYAFQATEADTLFAFHAGPDGCPIFEVFNLYFTDTVRTTVYAPDYFCYGATTTFSGSNLWGTERYWQSSNSGFIANTLSITVAINASDTLTFYQSDGSGCAVVEKRPVAVSKPDVQVESNQYQIMTGGSVQLHAYGAQNYHWSPEHTLDNPNISSPVATPLNTTKYIVEGRDSVGCADQESVEVIVGTTAFIPTLFTPNDDGKNDRLRIFGIDEVHAFRFSIFNRAGVLVYSSTNISEASAKGWDGTERGAKQPAGVYFWRIEGADSKGETVLLNGKKSGSIVLIR